MRVDQSVDKAWGSIRRARRAFRMTATSISSWSRAPERVSDTRARPRSFRRRTFQSRRSRFPVQYAANAWQFRCLAASDPGDRREERYPLPRPTRRPPEPHGNAQISGSKRRRIVDTIADHHHRSIFSLGQHQKNLLVRGQVRADRIQPQAFRHRFGDRPSVARRQQIRWMPNRRKLATSSAVPDRSASAMVR